MCKNDLLHTSQIPRHTEPLRSGIAIFTNGAAMRRELRKFMCRIEASTVALSHVSRTHATVNYIITQNTCCLLFNDIHVLQLWS